MNLNPFQNNNDNNMENINNIINKKRTLMIDLKGEPGKNCGGFCRFCYFRKVDNTNIYPLGCRNCTFQIGCDYCTYSVREINGDFIPLSFAIQQIQNGLFFQRYDKINITSGGDVSYYPHLRELCEYIKNLNLKIHLGYTSGKGFTYELAKYLVDLGMDEITFSVFATNEDLRKKWMNDKNPKESLKCLEYFCNNCETHCAIIVVPGVNDGKVLYDTLKNLSEWGAKATILMRFANYEYQGLILKNEKIIEGIDPHTLDEFKNIVDFANNNFGNDMRITGTPLYDPITKAPFALVNYERIINDLKNSVECESTIITGNVSYPFLKKIFDETPVNVVRVNKDISDLITKEDLESIDLKMVSDTVIIPPKAFVHDRVAEEIFNRDGGDRIVIRGVDRLTLDGEVSSEYTKEEVLNFERTAFNELIEKINFFGKRVR